MPSSLTSASASFESHAAISVRTSLTLTTPSPLISAGQSGSGVQFPELQTEPSPRYVPFPALHSDSVTSIQPPLLPTQHAPEGAALGFKVSRVLCACSKWIKPSTET